MKVGLVLGAGGLVGGAWEAGGLYALAQQGWRPAQADHIVGTSAGAFMAALVAAGVPPWRLLPGVSDELFGELITSEQSLALSARWRLPRIRPASWQFMLRALRDQDERLVLRALLGLLPQHSFSTEPIKAIVRQQVAAGWAPHPNCWIVACDHRSGERVVLGRPGAPSADLAQAVAASCALPCFYQPEPVGDRLLVDGGLYSMTNLDVLSGARLDLVIVLSPLSSQQPRRWWDPVERAHVTPCLIARRQLEGEAAALEAEGTRVVILEPTAEDLTCMGYDMMDPTRRTRVLQQAIRSIRRQLRSPELQSMLTELVGGRRVANADPPAGSLDAGNRPRLPAERSATPGMSRA